MHTSSCRISCAERAYVWTAPAASSNRLKSPSSPTPMVRSSTYTCCRQLNPQQQQRNPHQQRKTQRHSSSSSSNPFTGFPSSHSTSHAQIDELLLASVVAPASGLAQLEACRCRIRSSAAGSTASPDVLKRQVLTFVVCCSVVCHRRPAAGVSGGGRQRAGTL